MGIPLKFIALKWKTNKKINFKLVNKKIYPGGAESES